MLLRIHQNEPSVRLETIDQVHAALKDAEREARSIGRPNIIEFVSDVQSLLSIVVGAGDESVLLFQFGHGQPPYYVSRGPNNSEQPVFTAYVLLAHHTEFLRQWVISFEDAVFAVQQFFETGERPTNVTWEEV